MSDYTINKPKIEALIDEVLTLTAYEQHLFLQKIIFSVIKKEKSILIQLLRKYKVSGAEIAKELGVNQSIINRDFPKGGSK